MQAYMCVSISCGNRTALYREIRRGRCGIVRTLLRRAPRNSDRALETRPASGVGLYWIARRRSEFGVDLLTGQLATQDDAVKPSLIRRDVISAMHERPKGVLAVTSNTESMSVTSPSQESSRQDHLLA
jgi:hypothetical protein